MNGAAKYYLFKIDTTKHHHAGVVSEFGHGYDALIKSNREAR
jgi:hypothetical protein